MKKLYRSENQKIVGGVCGGIAEYFEVDPVLIRLLWIVLIIFGGTGLLAYIIAWIVIPRQNILNSEPSRPAEIKVEEKPEPASEPADNSSNARFFWGTVLILIGLLIIAQQFWWSFDFIRGMIRNFFRFFIPAVLIALGIFVILQGSNTSKRKNN